LRTKIKIEGLEKLVKRLEKLDKAMGRRILRKVLRAGGTILLRAARNAVPVDTGTLKKSLGLRIYAKRSTGVVYAIVGPRTKFLRTFGKRRLLASKYSHLTEFGRKKGKRGGVIRGRRWLERAAKTASGAALAAMIQKAEVEIEREASRA
jgi:HK97 gp10 family phage protein